VACLHSSAARYKEIDYSADVELIFGIQHCLPPGCTAHFGEAKDLFKGEAKGDRRAFASTKHVIIDCANFI
jgi:hypothetical protein